MQTKMQIGFTQQLARTSVRTPFVAAPSQLARSRQTFTVRAEDTRDRGARKLDEDSYQKIEAPVRGDAPDGGPPIRERETELDREIVASDGNKEKELLGTEVSIADAFRFKGALPEVANCRLAMLGVVSALGYEIIAHKSLAVQIREAPLLIAATFLVIIVATLVPILKGVPRRGSTEMGGPVPGLSSDAEIINGRIAMVGFLGLVITEALKGGPLFS
jgi:hypothetical protein